MSNVRSGKQEPARQRHVSNVPDGGIVEWRLFVSQKTVYERLVISTKYLEQARALRETLHSVQISAYKRLALIPTDGNALSALDLADELMANLDIQCEREGIADLGTTDER